MTILPKTKAVLVSWLKNYLHRKARLSGRGLAELCGDIGIYAKTDGFLYVLDEEKKEHQIGRVQLPMTEEQFEARERERAALIKTGHKGFIRRQFRDGTIQDPTAIVGEANGRQD
jgi:hypothetical protein